MYNYTLLFLKSDSNIKHNYQVTGSKQRASYVVFLFQECTKTHLRASGIAKIFSGGFTPNPRKGEGRLEGRGGGEAGREENGMKVCPTQLSELGCAPVCRQNLGNVPPIRRGTAQKVGGHPKKIFPALRAGFVPPHF